uniref:Uncharacterized protein n=1 Tax=Arundo donax TaxID=35708 RepID=A0A0A8ZYA3_ARUDO
MEAKTIVSDGIVEEADRDLIRRPRATSSGSAVIGAAS